MTPEGRDKDISEWDILYRTGPDLSIPRICPKLVNIMEFGHFGPFPGIPLWGHIPHYWYPPWNPHGYVPLDTTGPKPPFRPLLDPPNTPILDPKMAYFGPLLGPLPGPSLHLEIPCPIYLWLGPFGPSRGLHPRVPCSQTLQIPHFTPFQTPLRIGPCSLDP